MKKRIALLTAVFSGSFILASCGGGSTTTTSTTGTTAFYLTDAVYKGSQLQSVDISVSSITMVNSQSGQKCELFNAGQTPYVVDLTDLANSMRLLNVTNCEPGTYDKFEITISKNVQVMLNNNSQTCQVSTSTDVDGDGNDDVDSDTQVTCSGNECTITIPVEDGGLVISTGQNEVSLDFELNDSDGDGKASMVNIDNSGNCSIAFEIEEIEPEEFEQHADKDGDGNKDMELEGTVSNIDNQNGTITINTRLGTFTVSMGQSVNFPVQNITQNQNIRVEVECSQIDLDAKTCQANEIELKVKGTYIDNGSQTGIDIDGDGNIDIDTTGKNITMEGNIQNGTKVELEMKFDNGQWEHKEMEMDDSPSHNNP